MGGVRARITRRGGGPARGRRGRGVPARAGAVVLQQRAARAGPRTGRARRGARRDGGRVRRGRRRALRGLGARERRGAARPTSRRAATRSTRRRARWAWSSPTSASLRRSSSSRRRTWAEYLRVARARPAGGCSSGVDPARVPRADRPRSAARAWRPALAFDRDGDCGIYNVGTHEHARRRGLGTALTALLSTTPRARLPHGEPPVDRDGRAPLRGRRLPRPRPHPRVRAAAALSGGRAARCGPRRPAGARARPPGSARRACGPAPPTGGSRPGRPGCGRRRGSSP